MQLYNTLSAKERANLIDQAGEDRLTLSFYKYAQIEKPKAVPRLSFYSLEQAQCFGRIYTRN